MSYFIVCQFGPRGGGSYDWCAHVEADTPEEAASIGASIIEKESTDQKFEKGDTVYVAPIGFDGDQAGYYTLAFEAERSKLQCCGGSPWTDDGHTGVCEDRPGELP